MRALPTTLADALREPANNLDFLRFAAAACVIVSHAFPLALGVGTPEPLQDLTRGQTNLGRIAVAVFFLVSGLLVTRSLDRSRSVVVFARARALRILPGLAAAVLLTAFALGPVVTTLPLAEYLTDPEVPAYALKNATAVLQAPRLPGVFEGNPFPGTVNGSLWTLRYEVVAYAFVALAGALRLLRRRAVLPATLLALALLAAGIGGPWTELLAPFGVGSSAYLVRDRIRFDARWIPLALTALVLAALAGVGFRATFAVAGGFLLLFAAFAPSRLSGWARRDDLSYGLYVYAFPVQQAVASVLPGSWVLNVAVSVPVVLALAWGSWHLVEKRALRLKRVGTRRAEPAPP